MQMQVQVQFIHEHKHNSTKKCEETVMEFVVEFDVHVSVVRATASVSFKLAISFAFDPRKCGQSSL